jgi:hypothetical protein
MSLTFVEPDSPPSSGELEDYLYKEFLRIADNLNQNFSELEKRLIAIELKQVEFENRIHALENP